MECWCDVAHFGVRFESVQLGVKLNSMTGTIGQYKLYEHKINERNETECQYLGWSSYTPYHILACISNPSESVWHFPRRWVPPETANSIRTKSRHGMKLSAKHPNGVHMHPSSFRHAFRIRLSRCETLSMTGSIGQDKLHAQKIEQRDETACQHPEWNSYVP